MKASHIHLNRILKFLLLLILGSIQQQTIGQTRMKAKPLTNQKSAVRLAIDTPFRKNKIEIQDNTTVTVTGKNIPVMGSEEDGYAYLQTKKYCEFEKAVDDDGCVVIQYVDGGSKKICNDFLVEVITPDGLKHRITNYTFKQFVMKLDPPNNPPQNDVTYKWISGFNTEALKDISKLLKTDTDLNKFLKREYTICKDNVYRQMEYRSIFLQEYYKAK